MSDAPITIDRLKELVEFYSEHLGHLGSTKDTLTALRDYRRLREAHKFQFDGLTPYCAHCKKLSKDHDLVCTVQP